MKTFKEYLLEKFTIRYKNYLIIDTTHSVNRSKEKERLVYDRENFYKKLVDGFIKKNPNIKKDYILLYSKSEKQGA